MTLSMQLFGAGTETTSSALRLRLLHLCKHPEVQQRLHEEIEEHVGEADLTSF